MDDGRRTRSARSCVSRSKWVVLRMGARARASQHRLMIGHQSEAMQDNQQRSRAARGQVVLGTPAGDRYASHGKLRPHDPAWPNLCL
jgi:hypothetical protein